MNNENVVEWECECGELHEDPEFVDTHCRSCGMIVTVYEGAPAPYVKNGEKQYVFISEQA